MTKILLLTTSLCFLPGMALAADLYPPEQMPVLPASPPILSWAGFYAGGQLGYQWGRSTFSTHVPGEALTLQQPSYSDAGVLGGAHVGYLWQVHQFVFGLEGDIDGSNYNGSAQSLGTIRESTHENVMGSLRARAGYTWNRILAYGTGGVAFSTFRNTGSVAGVTQNADDTMRVGWTLGAGLEYAVNNDWSVRAEYRYTDTGHYSEFALGADVNHHQTDSRVQAGFSYKLDGFLAPPTVYARY